MPALWTVGNILRQSLQRSGLAARGSRLAAVKRSNWVFNHADILTASNLSWECASESVRAGLWLDHQDATPDRSKAEWDVAGNGCWWGKSISQCSLEFDGDSSADPEHPDWRRGHKQGCQCCRWLQEHSGFPDVVFWILMQNQTINIWNSVRPVCADCCLVLIRGCWLWVKGRNTRWAGQRPLHSCANHRF